MPEVRAIGRAIIAFRIGAARLAFSTRFTIETADHYARIRGALGLPPADAIHLASAAQAGTDLFLTNDKRLLGKFVPGIQFIAPLDTQLI